MKALKECFNDRTYIVKLFLYGSHLSVSEYVDLISCKKIYIITLVSHHDQHDHTIFSALLFVKDLTKVRLKLIYGVIKKRQRTTVAVALQLSRLFLIHKPSAPL